MKKNMFFRVLASALGSALFLSAFAACDNGITSGSSEIEEGSSEQELAVVEGEYLYRGGVSGYTVVLRDDANFYEELAATELAQNLAKATGSSIPIFRRASYLRILCSCGSSDFRVAWRIFRARCVYDASKKGIFF